MGEGVFMVELCQAHALLGYGGHDKNLQLKLAVSVGPHGLYAHAVTSVILLPIHLAAGTQTALPNCLYLAETLCRRAPGSTRTAAAASAPRAGGPFRSSPR